MFIVVGVKVGWVVVVIVHLYQDAKKLPIKPHKKQVLKVVKTTVKTLYRLKLEGKTTAFNHGLKSAHHKTINGK
ncbi:MULTISPECIES: hypothetical protein [Photorhabdus]|uniref:hypothetical protein n=1 Tax=Photorhabdus sp. S12-55 TaxID=2029686 RepID=UPI001EFE73C5|nr:MULTISPECIES: hypothetical protein [Photorhabdus]